MSRLLILTLAVGLAGCTIPTYEAEPVSSYQWQRRQDAIVRQEAERVRLCEATKDDDPRKAERCRGVGGNR